MVKAKKQFGQHWLTSEAALDAIIEASDLKPSDRVLEIGPGTGILTYRLLQQAATVLGSEVDDDLCQRLVKQFRRYKNFLLLQGSFLDLDLPHLLTNFPEFDHPNKVVANIPYNITGPILQRLLGTISAPHTHSYELIVLLVQKEVGERLVANPGSKAFGALSVRVQYLADCYHVWDVPARDFSPPPKVDSVVVKIKPRRLSHPASNPKNLDTLVKVGFANKRKMLKNNLKSLYAIEVLDQAFEELNLNPQCRGEELGLVDWVRLSDHLHPKPLLSVKSEEQA
ncbi:MAG: 16S rRNA (adenine(1518)-N(6)/adenine(1519)-N(6))-dimethyltransferase RsmA [Synechococcaceae cyanobacterium RL_1_2]|nr:16S rRNA (adenine(1518)-N(6)/adenine(1519)-N(6))-dimethyltransferase RsmA [Synechococcaceae cyanobacterium RL_1_2]